MLRDFGHEMRHAESGADALAMALEWWPDAILVDLVLPDFSGIELMRRGHARMPPASC
jgi:CheY-like chemotaxis protein